MASQKKRFKEDVCGTKHTPKFAREQYQLHTLFRHLRNLSSGLRAAGVAKGVIDSGISI